MIEVASAWRLNKWLFDLKNLYVFDLETVRTIGTYAIVNKKSGVSVYTITTYADAPDPDEVDSFKYNNLSRQISTEYIAEHKKEDVYELPKLVPLSEHVVSYLFPQFKTSHNLLQANPELKVMQAIDIETPHGRFIFYENLIFEFIIWNDSRLLYYQEVGSRLNPVFVYMCTKRKNDRHFLSDGTNNVAYVEALLETKTPDDIFKMAGKLVPLSGKRLNFVFPTFVSSGSYEMARAYKLETAPLSVQKIGNVIEDNEFSPPLYFDLSKHSDLKDMNFYYYYTLPETNTIRVVYADPLNHYRNNVKKAQALIDYIGYTEPTYDHVTWKLNGRSNPIFYSKKPYSPPPEAAPKAEPKAEPKADPNAVATLFDPQSYTALKAKSDGYRSAARQQKTLSVQPTPDSKIEMHDLPDVMKNEPELGPRQPLSQSDFFSWYQYYGKVDSKKMPIGYGTFVTNEGVEIYSPNWPQTDRLTFTCTNGLKFLAECNERLLIQTFIGTLAWGTSRMNYYEIIPHIDTTKDMEKKFYHALDVVDYKWGDNSRYMLDFLKTYDGVVRVIVMSHACIMPKFNLNINKLNRRMTAPHGVSNFFCPADMKYSLFQLFDSETDEFDLRMAEMARDTCMNPDIDLLIDNPLEIQKFRKSCSQMQTTLNKTFVKGEHVMNRIYSGPGFSPVYLGYKSADIGWTYVNIFAHWDMPFILLSGVLRMISQCSECMLFDNSCAKPCEGNIISQTDMELWGGNRKKSRNKKRKSMRKYESKISNKSKKYKRSSRKL